MSISHNLEWVAARLAWLTRFDREPDDVVLPLAACVQELVDWLQHERDDSWRRAGESLNMEWQRTVESLGPRLTLALGPGLSAFTKDLEVEASVARVDLGRRIVARAVDDVRSAVESIVTSIAVQRVGTPWKYAGYLALFVDGELRQISGLVDDVPLESVYDRSRTASGLTEDGAVLASAVTRRRLAPQLTEAVRCVADSEQADDRSRVILLAVPSRWSQVSPSAVPTRSENSERRDGRSSGSTPQSESPFTPVSITRASAIVTTSATGSVGTPARSERTDPCV